jgi:hypothetical protein
VGIWCIDESYNLYSNFVEKKRKIYHCGTRCPKIMVNDI